VFFIAIDNDVSKSIFHTTAVFSSAISYFLKSILIADVFASFIFHVSI
jgi:hypothetical protein